MCNTGTVGTYPIINAYQSLFYFILPMQACGRFESCATRGLHAHHPRDCLFYLRDFSVQELQYFLREHNVEFHTEPPQGQLDAARQNAAAKKEAAKGAQL